MSRWRGSLGELRRAAGWHRRLLAAGLVAAAVAFALSALAPAPPPRATAVAAARDLPGGAVLSPADLTTVTLPPDAVPAGALRAVDRVDGRTLAAPLRRGEVVTDVRLVSGGLAASLSTQGLVAAPVRIADAAAARLVHAGDTVDVLAAGDVVPGEAPSARVVASGVRVLAVPAPAGEAATRGALLVLAVGQDTATRLAAAAAGGELSLAIRAPA